MPRPEAAPGITIGRSTEADVIAIYGQPERRVENATTAEAGPKLAGSYPSTNTVLTFRNGTKTVFAYASPYVTRHREVTYRFRDGVLSGYAFTSGFPADTTALDTQAASAVLQRPDATLSDITAAIGPPRSRQTYPASNNDVSEIASWAGATYVAGHVVRTENLSVTFGRNGRMLRHSLTEDQVNQ